MPADSAACAEGKVIDERGTVWKDACDERTGGFSVVPSCNVRASDTDWPTPREFLVRPVAMASISR